MTFAMPTHSRREQDVARVARIAHTLSFIQSHP